MCTAVAMNMDGFYFGRNLDLEYRFDERVVFTPRNYCLNFRKEKPLGKHLALIGMATVRDGYPLYAEAANERGLCMAGLSFPDNAYYPHTLDDGKSNISPFELIPWVLGQCASVEEARSLLKETHITAVNFSEDLPLSPLHWIIADKNDSIVMEAVKEGVKIYDNPVGVLTNNPPFEFHLSNLSRYLNLSPHYPKDSVFKSVSLKPFGGGFGAIGLPGDWSSASRFVKAAFLKFCSPDCKDRIEGVTQFFHILDSVAMVNGGVVTADGRLEKTVYSCCISDGVYYYKTYANSSVCAVDMARENLDGTELKQYELIDRQQITQVN